MDPVIEALRTWFKEEHARRTRAVKAREVVPIEWLVPEYRVMWTEVWAKAEELGWKGNVVDLRLALFPLGGPADSGTALRGHRKKVRKGTDTFG